MCLIMQSLSFLFLTICLLPHSHTFRLVCVCVCVWSILSCPWHPLVSSFPIMQVLIHWPESKSQVNKSISSPLSNTHTHTHTPQSLCFSGPSHKVRQSITSRSFGVESEEGIKNFSCREEMKSMYKCVNPLAICSSSVKHCHSAQLNFSSN